MSLRVNQGDLEEWRTVVFLAFASVAFYLGCRKEKIGSYHTSIGEGKVINSNIISISLIMMLIISLMYLRELISYGLATMSFNLGDNYLERLEVEITKNSYWGRLNNLILPFRILLITYCVLHYKTLGKFIRFEFIALLLIMVLDSLFRGIQVGIGNVMVYVIVPLFFAMHKENKRKQFNKIFLWSLLIFIVFFVVSQVSRATAYDVDMADKYSDNFIVKTFGKKIGSGLLTLLSYFSHGYRGLNYSLQLPFVWTYGYGGSRAMNEYLQQYLNIQSMYNDTYPMRVKVVFGYDCEMSWPTAFSWWASDFSFPGVVILMFFLGILICRVVKDVLNSYSVVSISFLCQLVILIVFMPLNNQAFQARGALIATVLLAFLWMFKHKRIQ